MEKDLTDSYTDFIYAAYFLGVGVGVCTCARTHIGMQVPTGSRKGHWIFTWMQEAKLSCPLQEWLALFCSEPYLHLLLYFIFVCAYMYAYIYVFKAM